MNSFRKYIFCLLLFFTIVFFGFVKNINAAGLTVVQHTASESVANSTSISVTVNSTGSGNLLVVGIGNKGGRTVVSVTDGNNNFTQALNAAANNNPSMTDVWYLLSSTPGKTTFTVTFSGAAGTFLKFANIWEVSGFVAPAFDTANNIQGLGVGTVDTGATVTTSSANGFVVGEILTPAWVSVNPAAGNEFISGGDKTPGTDGGGASLISTVAGSHTPVWTDGNSGRTFAASTAAFKETSSPTDTTAPSVPSGLSATAVSTSAINLSWNISTDNIGVAGYFIYRAGVQVGTSVTNSYSDTNLNPSTLYSYTVDSYDVAGNHSSQSSQVLATTQSLPVSDTTPPSVPTNLSATAISSSQINLSWTASTDNIAVTGYKVFRGGGVQVGTTPPAGGTNNYNDNNLTANTAYSYTVSAYDAANNNSAQSVSSSATTQSSSGIHIYSVKAGGGGNYTTIQACSNVAVAGDTCEVYAGTYSGWTQNTNGSSGIPIVFKAHSGDLVSITGSSIILSSRSYITIQDFSDIRVQINANGSTSYCVIQNNHFATAFALNNVDGVGVNAHDNIFRGNVINLNSYRGSSRTPAVRLYGDSNLFENNEIYNGSADAFELGGRFVVVRGNYFHDSDGTISSEHIDFVQVVGGAVPTLSFSLIENNIAKNLVNQAHFLQIRASGGQIADTVITRYNFTYNVDSDFAGYGDHSDGTNTVPNGVVYNNTANTTTLRPENGDCAGFDSTGGFAWALNNICYNLETGGWSPTIFSQGGVGNGNIAFTTGYGGTWNSPYSAEATYNTLRNKDPLFASYPTDGKLLANSPAIDAGVALTTTSGSGSNSISMAVNNSHPFQPGWAGTFADSICVGTVSNCAQISSVNYSTNTINLTSSLSWSVGSSVFLFKNSNGTQVLYGSAPDIGAYEYSGTTTPTFTPGDFNHDGAVNSLDYSLLNANWFKSTNISVYDLQVDGLINSFDFAILKSNWGR